MINSPHDWRPSDERQYTFARSSGLPYGYFHRRVRWWRWLVLLAIVLLIACH